MNLQSLSDVARAELLARVAYRLTICARDTYEVGTDDVVEPKILRAYNELLHRVIRAVSSYLLKIPGWSIESIFEMVQDFCERHNQLGLVQWAKEPLMPYLPSPDDPHSVN